jgi:hypothetical protein
MRSSSGPGELRNDTDCPLRKERSTGHDGRMLNNLFSTAVSLRGQSWVGQLRLYLTQVTANVPTTIGGIFRIFPNK